MGILKQQFEAKESFWINILISSICFMILSIGAWIIVRVFLITPYNKKKEAMHIRGYNLKISRKFRKKKTNTAISYNKDGTEKKAIDMELGEDSTQLQQDGCDDLENISTSFRDDEANSSRIKRKETESGSKTAKSGSSSRRVIALEEIQIPAHSMHVKTAKMAKSNIKLPKTARSRRKKTVETGHTTKSDRSSEREDGTEESSTFSDNASSTISGSESELPSPLPSRSPPLHK